MFNKMFGHPPGLVTLLVWSLSCHPQHWISFEDKVKEIQHYSSDYINKHSEFITVSSTFVQVHGFRNQAA